MNYIEIVDRQSVVEAEMMERQEELQSLQQLRIAEAKKHEDLAVTHKLTSGKEVRIDLNYTDGDDETNIFDIEDAGEECSLSFSPEDYNEMSNFFSKYNDAIFSYMTEITKVEEDDKEADKE